MGISVIYLLQLFLASNNTCFGDILKTSQNKNWSGTLLSQGAKDVDSSLFKYKIVASSTAI